MPLTTPYEENRTGKEWDIYPRPQFVRSSFLSLNGSWELWKKNEKHQTAFVGEIQVPFAPESRLSGVGETLKRGERWIYRRRFSTPAMKDNEELILHFGAVDQVTSVTVNGQPVIMHEGGYLPFECSIRPFLHAGSDDEAHEENELEVEVTDDFDLDLPLGKQSLHRGGMWYTAHSGIWQSVWMEVVPKDAFRSFRIDAGLHGFTVTVVGGGREKRTLVMKDTGESVEFYGRTVKVEIDRPRLWSPEDPYLYEFSITNGSDTVESYTALREISVEKRKRKDGEEITAVILNGKPIFLHGLLDQGYYPDGIVLPASPEGYGRDIANMKELGFNLLRKHIKVEPEVYYYECDRQGMLVMQDVVNTGKYSFLVDTALPTAGFWHLPDHRASLRRRERFESDARELVTGLHNHPSVIGFTIFNEGWGQYEGSRIYRELKAMEPQMLLDTASGWFRTKESDFVSDHIYFRPIQMAKSGRKARTQGKILLLSEYGGYALALSGHRFDPEKVYGYKQFQTREELQKGLDQLIGTEVKEAISCGLAGAVLTQVSDVEDETNGMVTYDRQEIKVDIPQMKALAEDLYKTFQEQFN